ncbi:MAG: RNA-binding protein [Kiritimatiellae bacterium]|nr:RNA-binding protein [Kiritimatiellia bacterium]
MRIFVGNLSFKATDEDIREAFEPYGNVTSVELMRERDTGRSRGFAFVDMPDANEANKAMDALDGKALLGRPIRVNEAQARR